MIVKIIDYYYYNNKLGPILNLVCLTKDRRQVLLRVQDLDALRPMFGVLRNEWNELTNLGLFIEDSFVHSVVDGPDSPYGDKTYRVYTHFPWQVSRIKSNYVKTRNNPDRILSRTFYGDVRWEKMAMSKLIAILKLEAPFIEYSDDVQFRYYTLDDFNAVPKEKQFVVSPRIDYWDIESDSRNFTSRIEYEDYKLMPILSITGYDNWTDEYHTFVWHHSFEEDKIEEYDNYEIVDNINGYVHSLRKVFIHKFTNEKKVIIEYANWFGTNRFNNDLGFNSAGGYKVIGGKRRWFDGYDNQHLIERAKYLGLHEDLQVMSTCPLIPKKYTGFDGVYVRNNRGKHDVVMKGVGHIDIIYSNEVLGFTKKFTKFRGSGLRHYASFFLDYNKLDKKGKQVWWYWENDLKFMIDYNIIDTKICVDLDKKFQISKKQRSRIEVSISPFYDALKASNLHDQYKLTNYGDDYSLDTKYQEMYKPYQFTGKEQIEDKYTITLEFLEEQAKRNNPDVKYESLYDIRKVGGLVINPAPRGVYEKVVRIDFSKYYPNMIITTNAGIISAVDVDHYSQEYVFDKRGIKYKRKDLIETPVGFFRTDIKSLNTELFNRWMIERVNAQKELKAYVREYKTTKTDMYNILYDTQFNIKNFMNAGFGVLGLEIDRLFSLLAFNACTVSCYSDDTEILTKERGWILFKDLTIDDEVACLSKDHNMYWHKPLALQKYHRKDKMFRIKQKSVDFLITPDHNMYYKCYGAKNYKLGRVDSINQKTIEIPNSVEWVGEEKDWFYLPQIKTLKNNHKKIQKIKMDDWLRFLGWYISEGFYTKSPYYRIYICQSKKYNLSDIENSINNIGFKTKYYTDKFCILSKQLWSYLKKLGKAHEKYIPQEFMNLSKRQLKILYDALMKGDGHRRTKNRNKPHDIYTTTSKRLADQIQEIMIKLGFNGTVSSSIIENHYINDRLVKSNNLQYNIVSRKSLSHSLKPGEHFKRIDYDGFVYCCTVPENIILTRRNGWSNWCGNCQDVMLFVIDKLKEMGFNVIQNDSVVGERCVPIRKNGVVKIIPIERLWKNLYYDNHYTYYKKNLDRGKEYIIIDDIETLNEYGEWVKLDEIMRHKTSKRIFRVNQGIGETICTEDHSVITEDGEKSPQDIKESLIRNINNINRETIYSEDKIDLYELLKEYTITKHLTYPSERDVVLKWNTDGDNIWFGWRNMGKNQQTIKRYVNTSDLVRLLGIYVADEHSSTSCNSTFGALFHFLCGSGSENKRIPTFILNSSKRHIEEFLSYYMYGDGSINIKYNKFSLTTKSLELVSGLSYIFTLFGIKYSITYYDDRDVYMIQENKSGRRTRTTRVNELEEKERYVYDLCVKNGHKFVDCCGMILLHNTDSAMYRSGKRTYKSILREAKSVAKYLNIMIYDYMKECYNIKESTIRIDVEAIADKYYVDGKKHYVQRNLWFDGVWLKEPELEVKGMDLKKRATSKLGAQNQAELINALFYSDEPLDTIRDYIIEIDNKLEELDWDFVCKHGPLNKHLEEYDDSNQSATGGRNMFKYFGKYYTPGSNPYIAVFKRFPSTINGKPVDESDSMVLSFETEDIPMLKELGFELDWDEIRRAECSVKTEHLLGLFNESWYDIVENASVGNFLMI